MRAAEYPTPGAMEAQNPTAPGMEAPVGPGRRRGLLAALWISGKSAPSHLGSHDVRFLLLGTLVAAAIAAAIGVGLGALLRHQTAAIVLTLVWLLVGEPLLAIAGVQRYAPGHVTVAVIDAGRHSGQLLHFWPGVLLGLCYATFFAVTGAVAVARTDVT